MNLNTLYGMTADELDEYAKVLGFSAKACKTAADKAAMIERRRSRTATVSVLGMDFDILIKRAHDKRVSDAMARVGSSDGAAEEALALLLGDEQMADLVEACTDDDGTVDVDAMGLAYVKIVTSDELKNF